MFFGNDAFRVYNEFNIQTINAVIFYIRQQVIMN